MDFEKYLANLKENLGNLASLETSKPIQYGHVLQYKRGSEKVTLAVYHGKNGIRLVWQGNNALKQEMEAFVGAWTSAHKTDKRRSSMDDGIDSQLALQENADGELEAVFTEGVWAGSDESGKGDFFGPLVLGAVALDANSAMALKLAGVKDCKLLTDKKIVELEPIIKEKALAFSVLQLKPKFYNQRYAEVVQQGGKLNQLLASGHINALSRVLEQLAEKDITCQYALVDQFTKSNIVLRPLERRFPQVKFQQRPKAESNLAVAAASILARAQFLHTMAELAALAGLPELPKGGGAACTDCARMLAVRLGKESLVNFVKTHFANYKRL